MLSNKGIIKGSSINIKGTTDLLTQTIDSITLNGNSIIGTTSANTLQINSTSTFNSLPKGTADNDGTTNFELATVGYVKQKAINATVKITQPIDSFIETIPTENDGKRYIYSGVTTTEEPIYVKNYVYEYDTKEAKWIAQIPYQGLINYIINNDNFYTYLTTTGWIPANSPEAINKGYLLINIYKADTIDVGKYYINVNQQNTTETFNKIFYKDATDTKHYIEPYNNMIVFTTNDPSKTTNYKLYIYNQGLTQDIKWRLIECFNTASGEYTPGSAQIVFYNSTGEVITYTDYPTSSAVSLYYQGYLERTLLTINNFNITIPENAVAFVIDKPNQTSAISELFRPVQTKPSIGYASTQQTITLYTPGTGEVYYTQPLIINLTIKEDGTILGTLCQTPIYNVTYSSSYGSSTKSKYTISFNYSSQSNEFSQET